MKCRVHIENTSEDFSCRIDQHLLQGMQSFQVGKPLVDTIPVGCRGGGCGICRVQVLKGEYDTLKMSHKHISEEDKARGEVLACRVFPRTDLTIAVLPEGGCHG